MKRTQLPRYTLKLDGVDLGSSSSIRGIANLMGCSYQYIYRDIDDDGTIKYNKKVYTIVDRLA
jgi:hypothetical protein